MEKWLLPYTNSVITHLFHNREVVASRMFEKSHIQCVAFDPKGFLIGKKIYKNARVLNYMLQFFFFFLQSLFVLLPQTL